MMCGLENFQVNGVNIIQTTFNQTTTQVLGSQKGRLIETTLLNNQNIWCMAYKTSIASKLSKH